MYSNVWNGFRVRVGIHYGLGDILVDEVTKGYDYYGRWAASVTKEPFVLFFNPILCVLKDECISLRLMCFEGTEFNQFWVWVGQNTNPPGGCPEWAGSPPVSKEKPGSINLLYYFFFKKLTS